MSSKSRPDSSDRELRQLTTAEMEEFFHVSNVVVNASAGSSVEPVEAQDFKTLIAKAIPVAPDDSQLADWHYSPWCQITFETEKQKWSADLFLGGLVFLTDQQGSTVALKLNF